MTFDENEDYVLVEHETNGSTLSILDAEEINSFKISIRDELGKKEVYIHKDDFKQLLKGIGAL